MVPLPNGSRERLRNHPACSLKLAGTPPNLGGELGAIVPMGGTLSKFIIGPHMRLQEWVAEEKGYFKDEGLDYDFIDSTGFSQLSVKSATDP